MTRLPQSGKPVDDSNRRLGQFMAGIPDAPAAKPKGASVPWGLFTAAGAAVVALGFAVYWTMLR